MIIIIERSKTYTVVVAMLDVETADGDRHVATSELSVHVLVCALTFTPQTNEQLLMLLQQLLLIIAIERIRTYIVVGAMLSYAILRCDR